MDCETVRRALGALADGETAGVTREAAEAHAAVCPGCARADRATREIRAHFAGLPRPTAPLHLAARVRERLRGPAARIAPVLPMLRLAAAAASVLLLVTSAAILLVKDRPAPGAAALTADTAVDRILREIVRESTPALPGEVER